MENKNGSIEVAKQDMNELISNLVLNGDIGKMSNQMKVDYYNQLCYSLKLNPVTRPFEIISFKGKSKLYATKDCTEQLRKINGVSFVELQQDIKENLCITKCKAQDSTGRLDISTGVVNIAGLKGDDLANAIMKSETKAKRRCTLSICGLGMLDESELETLPKFDNPQIQKINLELPQNTEFYEKLINFLPTIKNKNELKTKYDKATLRNEYSHLSDEQKAEIDSCYVDCLNKLTEEESIIETVFDVEEIQNTTNLEIDPALLTVSDIIPEENNKETIEFINESIEILENCKPENLLRKYNALRKTGIYLLLSESEKQQIKNVYTNLKNNQNEN